VREVLVVALLVELEHRRRSARTQTLDLLHGEEPVGRRLATPDAELSFDVLDQIVRAVDHAGCRATDLKVVLADFVVVEHRVERHDLAYLLGRDPETGGNILHRLRADPPKLILDEPENGDDCRPLDGIVGEEFVDLRFAFGCEHSWLLVAGCWLLVADPKPATSNQ